MEGIRDVMDRRRPTQFVGAAIGPAKDCLPWAFPDDRVSGKESTSKVSPRVMCRSSEGRLDGEYGSREASFFGSRLVLSRACG